MKYIYFDTYAGFDVQMALGGLLDMTKDHTIANETASRLVKNASVYTEEVKRQSMDATLAYFDFCLTEEKPIPEIIDCADIAEDMKSLLKRWYKMKSDGKRRHFYEEINELLFCATSIAIIKDIAPDKIFISAIYQGKGAVIGENGIAPIPSAHTELLTKMSDLNVIQTQTELEILTPGGISFLHIMQAEHMAPRAHNVIKSGYGAGEENIALPNVARCILAEESEKELNLNLEELLGDICTEFSAMV